MTITPECVLDMLKMNYHVKFLGQKLLCSNVIVDIQAHLTKRSMWTTKAAKQHMLYQSMHKNSTGSEIPASLKLGSHKIHKPPHTVSNQNVRCIRRSRCRYGFVLHSQIHTDYVVKYQKHCTQEIQDTLSWRASS